MDAIVVGVDGSPNSLDALKWAAAEAGLRSCPLRVVGTFTTPIMSTGYEVAVPDTEDVRSAAQIMLDAAIDEVRSGGDLDDVELHTEIHEGHTGELLIGLSREAVMLVVGSRGHGGFLGLLLGSVTSYVVNHAECPVVVVRHTDG